MNGSRDGLFDMLTEIDHKRLSSIRHKDNLWS